MELPFLLPAYQQTQTEGTTTDGGSRAARRQTALSASLKKCLYTGFSLLALESKVSVGAVAFGNVLTFWGWAAEGFCTN